MYFYNTNSPSTRYKNIAQQTLKARPRNPWVRNSYDTLTLKSDIDSLSFSDKCTIACTILAVWWAPAEASIVILEIVCIAPARLRVT